jgi:DNA-binding response OmpR family regulator
MSRRRRTIDGQLSTARGAVVSRGSGDPADLVIVISPDDLFADAVDHVLNAAGFDVRRAIRGPGDPLIEQLRPGLILLDLGDDRSSEHAGAVSRVRRSGDAPLVVLTRSTLVDDRLAAFEAGADDVWVQPVPLAELRWKVSAATRRSASRADTLALGDLRIDTVAHLVERNGQALDLTALEFSLLVALGRHQRAVLSKTQLLTMVWGFDHHDVNLVEVHVSALRRKLEAAGPRILHTVRGVGYVLRPLGADRPPAPSVVGPMPTSLDDAARLLRTAI